ncbi:class I SAM-dependent methyltransferase [Streptomyces lydicus]|uniref:class I SAM-dependent methyltransferase n=1 Tax=Streptomyces lydicus TaxID=47763 RepID=UPI003401AEFF
MAHPEFDQAPPNWAGTFFDGGFEETFRRRGAYESTAQDINDLCSTSLLSNASVRILDVACGFGRHTSLLAERGHYVVGIDASAHQIKRAQELYPQGKFAVGDMRQPPQGPFDVVLNLWTSFGILPSDTEDLAALTAWCRVLAPSGALIMDLTTRERAEYLNRRADEPVTTKKVTRGGVMTEARYDWESGISYVRYSRPGWSRSSRTRLYSRRELAAMLRAAGFVSVGYWGDFRLGPVDPAKRLVAIATTGEASESAPHRLGG